MSCTIEELRKRKEDLEGDIRALLMDFQRETGLEVTGIHVSTFDRHAALLDHVWIERVQVDVDMRLR